MRPVPAGIIVFAASAVVLTLEILALRLVAPFVGVTLETYTGIIGTVLAGISLGAWLGGVLADRISPRRLLGALLLVGGALALLTVPAVRALGPRVQGGGAGAIVTLAMAGFFAPAAVLSAVTPTVARLLLRDLGHTGRVVGSLSAVATAGALVGTFASGFVLVAAFPTAPVIFVLGAGLVVVGAAISLATPAPKAILSVLLPVAAVGGLLTLGSSGPCQVESAYFCARVEVDPTRANGRVLILDTLRHSYVDLDDPTWLEFRYARLFADVIDGMRAPGDALQALHIGGGGFTIPRYIHSTRPGSHNLVLELDPVIVRIAREELGLQTGERLQVRTGDARVGILDEPAGAYDLVVGDAFGGLAVPWHLTTREFTEEIRRVLRDDGVYLLNVIDYPPLRFVKAELATLRAVFPYVAALATESAAAGRGGGNFVAVASPRPIDGDALASRVADRGGRERLLMGSPLDAYIGGARVLTDDHAPVDQLISHR